jgi:hypothetical protein
MASQRRRRRVCGREADIQPFVRATLEEVSPLLGFVLRPPYPLRVPHGGEGGGAADQAGERQPQREPQEGNLKRVMPWMRVDDQRRAGETVTSSWACSGSSGPEHHGLLQGVQRRHRPHPARS